ncbi:anti-sigma factor [Pseudonocardia nantongensis]|uniref:anti-sigma factor n=1 Tax=Pseudonocardia nantongensis TaxID=1181885 RepID=UPI003979E158
MNGEQEPVCPMAEQTIGWALHALEPDEDVAVIEHLAGCERCRQVAADVSEVTTGLASVLPQHEPPSGLRDSIVEHARRTPQQGRPGGTDERPVPGDRLGTMPTGRHAASSPPEAPAPPPTREPAARPPVPSARPGGPAGRSPSASEGNADRPPGPGNARRKSRFGRPGRLLVAAVAVVAVLVGAGAVVGQVRALQAERDASLAQAQQMHEVMNMMAQPGTEHAFLAPDAPGATPVAALLVHDGQRQLVPMGLSPNQVDQQTYVLWGVNGDAAPTAVGTFDVHGDSAGPVPVASSGGGTFAQYAVSLERGRTAPPAPSSVVAAGQVET